MPQIQPLPIAQATGDTAKALAAVKSKLGTVPNMFATLANAPAALQFYLQGSAALERGRFTAKQRELVALAVADVNACGYCLAAHTALGGLVGLQAPEMEAARHGHAGGVKDSGLVKLAQRIVETRGNLAPADLSAARASGLEDADILEAIAVVAVNIFTNYTNHIAGTEVDFPPVAARRAA